MANLFLKYRYFGNFSVPHNKQSETNSPNSGRFESKNLGNILIYDILRVARSAESV